MDARTRACQLGQAATAAEFDVVGVGADCQNVEGHGRVLAKTEGAAGRWNVPRERGGTIATRATRKIRINLKM
ncbi:hypothetical protein G6F22_022137 [Rhizopus arrhizus]|nr:hypothetical protein G6F22_022137 [Rhizopus arrhizus]